MSHDSCGNIKFSEVSKDIKTEVKIRKIYKLHMFTHARIF